MIHLLNILPKLFCCSSRAFWVCSALNISYHSDDLFQTFAQVFLWWVRLHYHQTKLNGTASIVFSRSRYHPLKKSIFSSPKICGNILNIFGVGIKPPKLLYKTNWDTKIWIVLLERLICSRLCILLVIYEICFIEDKAPVMWLS